MRMNQRKAGVLFLSAIVILIVIAGWLKTYQGQLHASAANPLSFTGTKKTPGDSGANLNNGSSPSVRTVAVNNQDTTGAPELQPCPDGTFLFNNVNMATIIKELSLYYHMKVQCKGVLPKNTHFGTFSRCEPLSQILSFLHQQTHIGFTIKQDSIIVQP